MAIDPTASLHPTAIIEDGAQIGASVVIGPYCVIGGGVSLASGVTVKSHAVIVGETSIGEQTVIFPGACVGEVPQDLKYAGERTQLVIGKRNRIREAATLNCGTAHGRGETRVGDDCLFMTGSHVGHDCIVGDRVVMANHAALGGHCVIDDHVTIGGLSGIHQWVRIGEGAFIGAVTHVQRDVVPNAMVQGAPARLTGLNIRGLRRRAVSNADISELQARFNELFEGPGTVHDQAHAMRARGAHSPSVDTMLTFVLEQTSRSLLVPAGAEDADTR